MESVDLSASEDSVFLQPGRPYPAPPPLLSSTSSSDSSSPRLHSISPSEYQSQQPESGPESQEKAEDWVIIYRFKTTRCEKLVCARWKDCWNYHCESDRRRIPIFDPALGWFNYFSKKCLDVRPHTDCGYVHNNYEMSFHPLLYRTKMCKGLMIQDACSIYGRFCGYAHSAKELRSTTETYPLKTTMESQGWVKPGSDPLPRYVNAPPGFHPFPTYKEQKDLPPVTIPVGSSLSSDDLLSLYRLRGALEAKLKQIHSLLLQRKAALQCSGCGQDQRVFVFSACGHNICFQCSNKDRGHEVCSSCGKTGVLVLIQQT